MDQQIDKKGKIACAGAGGSMGLAALAGACATGCGFAAAPLFGLLTSLGLGGVAAFLPNLRIPLVLIALGFGIYAIRAFIRTRNVIGAAVCGCALGAGGAFLGWQMMAANDCKTASQIETVLQQLSPESKLVFQKGLYPLWPELGRAPSIAEIQKRMNMSSPEPVMHAFKELETMGFNGIFFPGTTNIKWFWPFSSLDHGVEVTLKGEKTVHARCAIDALGMSAMFGKPANVKIQSPVDKKMIEMEIDGSRVATASTNTVVSYSDSCDEMLFFASEEEFHRYVKSTGKNYLKLYSLKEALERGIQSFGGVLKT